MPIRTDWTLDETVMPKDMNDIGKGINSLEEKTKQLGDNKLDKTGGVVTGTINAENLQVGGNNVYHTARKPSAADVGAAPTVHAHDDRYYTEAEMNVSMSKKVDKVTGKDLSTNDFTNEHLNKLNGIAPGANAYVHPSTHSIEIITETSSKKIMTFEERNKLNNSYTSAQVDVAISTAINSLINGSPGALDTLKELADAMGNDPNFAATVTNKIATKVDKVTGKQLSTEDFTTALLAKLNGIAAGANKYTLPVATSSVLGGVKSGTDITVDSAGNVSINDNSHNHLSTDITATALNNENLNIITTPGRYYAAGSNNVINKPSGVDNFGLIVLKSAGGYTTQMLTDSTKNSLYMRVIQASPTSWVKFAISSDPPSSHKHTAYDIEGDSSHQFVTGEEKAIWKDWSTIDLLNISGTGQAEVGGTVQVRRIGNMCFVNFDIYRNNSAYPNFSTEWWCLGRLPVGYRPVYYCWGTAREQNTLTGNDNSQASLDIETGGNISFVSWQKAKNIAGCIAYICQ